MVSIFSRYLIPSYFGPSVESGALLSALEVEEEVQPTVMLTLRDFNPNEVTKEALQKFGINEKTAKSWENYISKNGRFYKPEDVLKIHGMTYDDYDFIKDHIKIPDNSNKKNTVKMGSEWKKSKTDETKIKLKINTLFDPNNISKRELASIGINKKAIKSWINYLSKGGKFYKVADIQKVYHLSESEFGALEPYIRINQVSKLSAYAEEDATSVKKKKDKSKAINKGVRNKKKNVVISINMNSASAKEWQSISGIGPVLSKRIVKFRDKLGGFHSKEQLAQVYGMEENYEKFISFLTLTKDSHKRLNIYTASEKELSKHLFISYKTAKQIKEAVKDKPEIRMENLMEIDGIDKKALGKAMPYLILQK
jgi:competence ComEA-like helix-hairpin-helix protein